MSYKLRKFLCAMVLLIGLPAYIVASVTIVNMFERPGIFIELCIYVGLGVLWALPFKSLFKGIGRPDPDAPAEEGDQR
jgi:hypothetical protein